MGWMLKIPRPVGQSGGTLRPERSVRKGVESLGGNRCLEWCFWNSPAVVNSLGSCKSSRPGGNPNTIS